MATENIRINYDVTGLKDIKEATKELDQLNQETEETTEKTKEASKSASGLSKAFGSLGDRVQQSLNTFQIAGRGLGDMSASMLRLGTATGKTTKAMRLLKIAIAATGIGALVVALGSLVTAFTKTQKGADTINKIFGEIGATVDVVVGRIAQFGQGLLKIIKGEEGGVEQIKNSFKDVGAEIKGAIKDADKLADTQVKLRKIQIEVTAATARRSRLIQDQLIITRDFNRSFEDQKAALDKANKLELANQRDFVRLARERLRVAEQELEFTPETLRTDEQRLVIAEAKAELENVIAISTAKQREILNRRNELEIRRLSTLKAQTAVRS